MAPSADGSVADGIGLELSDEEAAALAAGYRALAAALAKFSEAELKEVEPPLWAIPAPPAAG